MLKNENQMYHAAEFINENMSWAGQIDLLALLFITRGDLTTALRGLAAIHKSVSEGKEISQQQTDAVGTLIDSLTEKFQAEEDNLTELLKIHDLTIGKIIDESAARESRPIRSNVRKQEGI
jgi:hypothetical protein